MKEYLTKLLSGHPPKAEDQINEPAREGWELTTVSFNCGYFEREKPERKLYKTGKEKNDNL